MQFRLYKDDGFMFTGDSEYEVLNKAGMHIKPGLAASEWVHPVPKDKKAKSKVSTFLHYGTRNYHRESINTPPIAVIRCGLPKVLDKLPLPWSPLFVEEIQPNKTNVTKKVKPSAATSHRGSVSRDSRFSRKGNLRRRKKEPKSRIHAPVRMVKKRRKSKRAR